MLAIIVNKSMNIMLKFVTVNVGHILRYVIFYNMKEMLIVSVFTEIYLNTSPTLYALIETDKTSNFVDKIS